MATRNCGWMKFHKALDKGALGPGEKVAEGERGSVLFYRASYEERGGQVSGLGMVREVLS
ncbi:hypothetical protein BOTNAR_0150g00120 [Botryotinia narcissicola]|uniref:Uncharacterized protein n=1 Tax=Botryotinia narcissicola TaxID=278944 RepID=A0A4Z1ILR9_9HELO|nr:hypothetical protein BOTNAR_0150g00120 [Botryotinia narcissicola]